mmetsp:Transcript_83605/g.159521  ORF Transcript_83605/g.159521 Transcript_83605/m.159521 type:complete len:438 (+) Transcript_83605:78-1391(+)
MLRGVQSGMHHHRNPCLDGRISNLGKRLLIIIATWSSTSRPMLMSVKAHVVTSKSAKLLRRSAPHHGSSTLQERGDSLGVPELAKAFVLTIDADRPSMIEHQLMLDGIPSETVLGFNASAPEEKVEAISFLSSIGYTQSVHWLFSVPFACLHTSPHTSPTLSYFFAEMWSHLGNIRQNFTELVATDSHACVAKVVGIAASHARIWKDLAEYRLPQPNGQHQEDDEDKWFLILEDDVLLCPEWLRRLKEELPQAPEDADMLKLSYFGHWRPEDAVFLPPDNRSTPFLRANNTMDTYGVLSECMTHLLEGRGLTSVPCAGFYAGNQAYLLKRKSARQLLAALHGQPFQDLDVAVMDLVNTYVWRRVLAVEGPKRQDDSAEEQFPISEEAVVPQGLQIPLGSKRAAHQRNSDPPNFLQLSSRSSNTFIPACNQDPAVLDA